MPDLPPGAVSVTLPDGRAIVVPEETPVALVFDGVTQAVMMATPNDLEDFLLGFACTEGLISRAEELSNIEALEHPLGREVRGWLPRASGAAFKARRRAMAGPVGCGLCGIDSLEQALRPLASLARSEPVGAGQEGEAGFTPAEPPGTAAASGIVSGPRASVAPRSGMAREHISLEEAARALEALRPAQVLGRATRATHAAGFWGGEPQGLMVLREDVGRHNALDKLAGALLRAGQDPASGAVVMTSRLSVDLVQKAVMMGARTIIAPSAPTALAVAEAQAAGLEVLARAEGAVARFTS